MEISIHLFIYGALISIIAFFLYRFFSKSDEANSEEKADIKAVYSQLMENSQVFTQQLANTSLLIAQNKSELNLLKQDLRHHKEFTRERLNISKQISDLEGKL